MKVKEVNLTASIAWSPKSSGTPYLACGTAAPHADSVAKSDALQVYSLNLKEENLSMKLAGSVSTKTRFHKVVWGTGGPQIVGNEGVIACAGDNGGIYLYNGGEMIRGGASPLIHAMEGKHAGPVYTIDFNHHQHNMLASGSKDCEVFIWDINEPGTPMSPAPKATLSSDVTCVAWNRQVEKILASCYGGRCVVFDCLKSKSIFQISDAVSRVKANSVCWHPTVATQLALTSYDDVTPVLQIWDLRFPSGPLRQCEGHQRGIQSLAWCTDDGDMLLTAAKDNRVLCWNPNTGEALCELPSYNQWSFEVDWCPRDPALVATASVDGSVSVYSMLGGGYAPPRDFKFSAIADSFPGMEMPAEVPSAAQPQYIYPVKAPAFLARGIGVSFGFGGRLLSWSKDSREVSVSQVVTEPQLVQHSNELMAALQAASLHDYCTQKLATADTHQEKEVWQYISASLYGDNAQYLSLLGHPAPAPVVNHLTAHEESLSAQMAALGATDGSSGSLDPSEQFEMIASSQSADKTPEPELLDRESPPCPSPPVLVSPDGSGGAIRKAVMTGQLEEAVELCLQAAKFSLALVIAHHAGQEIFLKTRDRVLTLETDSLSVCGLVAAVVKGDLENLVATCPVRDWKEAVVTVINHSQSQEQLSALLQSLGTRLQASGQLQAALLCFVVSGSLDSFVRCWVHMRESDGELSTQNLQELVEVILVLQQTGRCVSDTAQSSAVGQYLAQYASLLATQGALSTAYHYLASNNNLQEQLVALRDRLGHALGYTGSAGRGRSTSTCSTGQPRGGFRRTSTPQAQSGLDFPAYHIVPAQFTPSVQARQASAFAPSGPVTQQPPPLGGGAAQAPAPQFYQPTQQQQMFTPQSGAFGAPPSAPPGPAAPSVAPPSASVAAPGGKPERTPSRLDMNRQGLRRPGASSRYVSAVTSQPQSSTNSFTPFQPNPNPAPFQPTSTSNPAPFQPAPPSNPAPFQPAPPSNPAPFQPAPPSNPAPFQPAPPSNPAPFQPSNPAQPSFLNPSSSAPTAFAPPPTGLPFDPTSQAAQGPTEPSKPPAAYDSSLPRGWNDPPPMSSSRRTKQQGQSPRAPAPEAVNAMVPTPNQPLPPPQQQFQGFQGFQPPSSGAGFPPQQEAPPQPALPPAPIPPEAKGVHDVLSRLFGAAMQRAPNLTTQQTLQTVAPKLEILYDKFRAGQISPATLSGLQKMVSCIEAGDYHTALQAHSQTVASGNFTEMSAFMPPIKKLLTTCMQHQLYLS